MSRIKKDIYILKAYYNWICDNKLTPYISVITDKKDVVVPRDYINNNSITLNIDKQVTNNFSIGKKTITFEASFQGKIEKISIPIECISYIYSVEEKSGYDFNNHLHIYGLDEEKNTYSEDQDNIETENKNSTHQVKKIKEINQNIIYLDDFREK